MARKSGGGHVITDRQLLAELIRDAIDRLDGGSEVAAAKRSGMSRSTLRRFASGRAPSIHPENLARVVALLTGDGDFLRRLEACVSWQQTPGRLAAYALWLAEELETLQALDTGIPGLSPIGLVDLLETRFPRCFKPLQGVIAAGGFDPRRVEVARLRVVAPWLISTKTDGVERHITDLDKDSLLEVLQAGVLIETACLSRDPDALRTHQRVSELPPFSYERMWAEQLASPTLAAESSLTGLDDPLPSAIAITKLAADIEARDAERFDQEERGVTPIRVGLGPRPSRENHDWYAVKDPEGNVVENTDGRAMFESERRRQNEPVAEDRRIQSDAPRRPKGRSKPRATRAVGTDAAKIAVSNTNADEGLLPEARQRYRQERELSEQRKQRRDHHGALNAIAEEPGLSDGTKATSESG